VPAPAPAPSSTTPTSTDSARSTTSTGDTGATDPSAVTAMLLDQVIVGTHTAALKTTTAALAQAAAAFCSDPSEAGLQAVREAWWAARAPLKRLEIVQFGPMTEEPWRIGPKLDFWPGRPSSVEAYLASGAGVGAADFDLMGGATRGFPALEIVLYRTLDDGTDPYDALVADPHRCAYLVGGSEDTHVLAARFEEGWLDDWRGRLVDPSSADDDDYHVDHDVIDEWVNRMAFTVEDLRFEKLGKPFGDSAGGEPQPDTLESRYAARSLTDARDALLGVADVFHGSPAGTGIVALLGEDDAALIAAFDEAFAAADAALLAIPETLETAVVDDRDTVFDAQNALRDLQVVIQVDLAAALGVTIVFNDNDGD
jgi:predicted lipoprotein